MNCYIDIKLYINYHYIVTVIKEVTIMKNTKQKEAILSAVSTMHNHPTADEVYAKLRKDFPNLSLGTVYRNLNSFANNGFIRKVAVHGTGDRFDFRLDQHEHLLCEQCGKLFDVDAEVCITPKDEAVQIAGYKLMLYGTCGQCG